MGHPNLSDDINRKIDSQNQDTGVFIKNLPKGTFVQVQTQNSTYIFECLGGSNIAIQGNGRYFNDRTEGALAGSTWGGSMLKMGWVGVGMHMEVWTQATGTVTTSEIAMVRVIRGQTWLDLVKELLGLWK